jgi:hypothetical protein
VYFYSCKRIWSRESTYNLEPLEILLGLQYMEWFENLSLTSTLANKENLLIYQLWNSLLTKENLDLKIQPLFLQKVRENISSEPKEYGHLTIRHFYSEIERQLLLNHIIDFTLQRRRIQRESGPRPSHFKRSSDHSSSTSRTSSRGREPTPKNKEFSISELQNYYGFSIQERKLLLLGGSP